MFSQAILRRVGLTAAATALVAGCATPITSEPDSPPSRSASAESRFRADLELRRQDAARYGRRIISVDPDKWTIVAEVLPGTACVPSSEPTLNPTTAVDENELQKTAEAIALLNRGIALRRPVTVILRQFNGTCR